MKNLVLIGLSGCGKSTFGRRLAKRLRLPLLDTDVMIEKKTGRTIPDIFAADGESGFRDIESACAREAAAVQGAVISTGGGMILREENMKELSKNGLVVFIDRHPSRILRSTTLKDRPLVQDDKDKLFRLYAARLALYRRHADVTVPNHGGPRTLKRRILQVLRHYRRSNSHV
ncbi:shikimate kinase [uncultured Mailhella sp.]|uniref:shikimate kinase n=1 Tax=uncultured Mailhella sp. TaxID=1981031 RepID=UPI0025E28927|nr:shikimate kinase [uncultured Mailhella sp.]